MAERVWRDNTSSRRQSFRRAIADTSLNPEYFDHLELKRRQLDESIHKYIAQKEREFKAFEKELRHEFKPAHDRELTTRRRTSSESFFEPPTSPLLRSHDALGGQAGPASGPSRERDRDHEHLPHRPAEPHASLARRRASLEREKDFMGVFTPGYLLALDSKSDASSVRTSSAPPAIDKDGRDKGTVTAPQEFQRAYSDTVVQTKPSAPALLTLASRTPSTGSSVDGRLASALKSTSQPARPKQKRVSLAVGDAIVAPSDSVPVALHHNSSSSHSWTRPPPPEPLVAVLDFQTTASASRPGELSPATSHRGHDGSVSSPVGGHGTVEGAAAQAKGGAPSSRRIQTPLHSPTFDPDGDMSFDLEHEEMHARSDAADSDADESDIAGRIESSIPESPRVNDQGYYESSEGLVPSIGKHAEEVAFAPGSAVASQQPTNPGFRRPSVSIDPIYRGPDYTRAEKQSVEEDVYGSSYSRPASKGSYTAGSVGESLMDSFYHRRKGPGPSSGQAEVQL